MKKRGWWYKPMTEVQILPMTEADYDAVRALWMTIRGFGIRALDDSREDVVRFIRRNPTTSVVAKADGKIVGSILCGSDGRQGALYHVCVAKEYRRQGIGTRMVGYCMQQLKALGINKVGLIAFTKNDAGNAFWKEIGWKKSDVNYYEFVLNKENITHFIGEEA
jgi:ribosomal protein S18 acetylase RimI-like enzyme